MSLSRREFVRTLFVATAQVALTGPLLSRSLFAASSPTSPEGLNFLVFGDWGRKGQKDQLDVARQMGIAADQIGARFIVSVGDNFYDYGVSSVDDPQFKTSFEQVYTAPSLQVPWQVILGNHDYRGNSQAQLDYSKVNTRWNMPDRYFVRNEQIPGGGPADLIYIDTNPFIHSYAKDLRMGEQIRSQDSAKQLGWIEEQLAKSTAPWKIVIGHHPIYSGGEHGDTPELIEHLFPLLQKYKVQAYFAGHDHDLQHLQAGGVNLFGSGAGSTVRATKMIEQSKYSKSQPGFMAVSLRPELMEIRMIDGLGQMIYQTSVSQKIS